MSLINDALKRARQAQPTTPSHRSQPMTPAADRRPAYWPILLVPLLLIGVVVVATWFFWQAANASRQALAQPPVLRAQARENPRLVTSSPPMLSPSPVNQSSPATDFSTPSAIPVPALIPANPSGGAVQDQTTSVQVASAAPPVTNPPPVEPSKPPPLKLKAIIYQPDNPSVLINSKTLFLGDKIGDSRVIDITQDSVKLLCQGQTNVLTLE